MLGRGVSRIGNGEGSSIGSRDTGIRLRTIRTWCKLRLLIRPHPIYRALRRRFRLRLVRRFRPGCSWLRPGWLDWWCSMAKDNSSTLILLGAAAVAVYGYTQGWFAWLFGSTATATATTPASGTSASSTGTTASGSTVLVTNS